MKKLLFTAALALFLTNSTTAQTSKGTILVGTNIGNAMVGGTNIGFTSTDGESILSIGADAGYFIMDDLAIKVGLGYSSDSASDTNTFAYRLGAKYYLMGKLPLTVDFTGASIKDLDENPSWLGLGAGYAIFLTENISLEPGLRYNLTMNDKFTEENVFQFNVGFALHF
ncbi:porin family protein [Flavobacteriaceae bacterium]|nr:porin family protein [Flavobacteriaceae bacterium]